ncbi:MAG: DUF58 domain-containing protein [Bifidobacteriaceae bacterium]|jgi:uncharacterized protein (DUF58 family)|nr:DUF58 domain-containing protein [Bifidobacteriaceae bacterium]
MLARAVSPLGWGALILGSVMAAGGWLAGWTELLVPGAALLAAVAFGFAALVGASGLNVSLRAEPIRVTQGGEAVGEVTVRNAGSRRSLPALLEVPTGRRVQQWRMPSLRASAQFQRRFNIDTSRRAVLRIGPVSSRRGDPLGLVSIPTRWSEPVEVYVRPRLAEAVQMNAGVLSDIEGKAVADHADSGLSFHSLRDYTSGDAWSRIDWKVSAKRRTLTVREFEDTRRTEVALALATNADAYGDWTDFELAVSVFASLGVKALQEDLTVGAVAGGPAPTAGPQRLLDWCCRIQRSDQGWDISRSARLLAQVAQGATVVALITGGQASRDMMRAATLALPAGARVLAIRAASGAASGGAVIGHLVHLTIGSLDDLPRLASLAVPVGR